ncbi:MAG: 30S ribosomal protein S6 [Rhodothermales bacterium]
MTETRNMYELTYIINAVLNDDQIKNVVTRVKEIIEKNGGEVVDTDEWGSRRLAYPIEKKRNGYYVNLYANLIGPSIPRIERSMEIDDDILRYLTLRMDAKMIRHYERTRKAKADAAAAESTDA